MTWFWSIGSFNSCYYTFFLYLSKCFSFFLYGCICLLHFYLFYLFIYFLFFSGNNFSFVTGYFTGSSVQCLHVFPICHFASVCPWCALPRYISLYTSWRAVLPCIGGLWTAIYFFLQSPRCGVWGMCKAVSFTYAVVGLLPLRRGNCSVD